MDFNKVKKVFTGANYSYGILGMYFKTTIVEVEEIKDDFWGDKARLTLKDNLGFIDVPMAKIKRVDDIEEVEYHYILKNLLDEEIGHVLRSL